ncbi:hypothetical protein [Streptomyces sp. SID5910]|uniref:DUF7296 family protein n=1 Tax=Streptomyces sp. SID5910 TaxID=2690312 RepID=UPI00136C95D8|nr:hypothetical protein [Streptomyces sp. SID5910]MYR43102.1 hypothetical protein [Streptomyces sp. SID5910]
MFFEFNQNNSGGGFDFDAERGITHHVIVEADDAAHANYRAERIGLYFDGDGDCACCGYRWSEQWAADKGDEVPSIYGEAVQDYDFRYRWMGADRPEAYVHFADGRVQGYGFGPKVLK